MIIWEFNSQSQAISSIQVSLRDAMPEADDETRLRIARAVFEAMMTLDCNRTPRCAE